MVPSQQSSVSSSQSGYQVTASWKPELLEGCSDPSRWPWAGGSQTQWRQEESKGDMSALETQRRDKIGQRGWLDAGQEGGCSGGHIKHIWSCLCADDLPSDLLHLLLSLFLFISHITEIYFKISDKVYFLFMLSWCRSSCLLIPQHMKSDEQDQGSKKELDLGSQVMHTLWDCGEAVAAQSKSWST